MGTILKILLAAAVVCVKVAVAVALPALVGMLAWNYLALTLFHLPQVTFVQAFLVAFLAGLVVGFFRGRLTSKE